MLWIPNRLRAKLNVGYEGSQKIELLGKHLSVIFICKNQSTAALTSSCLEFSKQDVKHNPGAVPSLKPVWGGGPGTQENRLGLRVGKGGRLEGLGAARFAWHNGVPPSNLGQHVG